jgi:hypothetical protein
MRKSPVLVWHGPVTITAADRLASSVNGNPRFRLHLSNGETVQTSSDSSVAYDVENFIQRRARFTYTLTRAGRMDRATVATR